MSAPPSVRTLLKAFLIRSKIDPGLHGALLAMDAKAAEKIGHFVVVCKNFLALAKGEVDEPQAIKLSAVSSTELVRQLALSSSYKVNYISPISPIPALMALSGSFEIKNANVSLRNKANALALGTFKDVSQGKMDNVKLAAYCAATGAGAVVKLPIKSYRRVAAWLPFVQFATTPHLAVTTNVLFNNPQLNLFLLEPNDKADAFTKALMKQMYQLPARMDKNLAAINDSHFIIPPGAKTFNFLCNQEASGAIQIAVVSHPDLEKLQKSLAHGPTYVVRYHSDPKKCCAPKTVVGDENSSGTWTQLFNAFEKEGVNPLKEEYYGEFGAFGDSFLKAMWLLESAQAHGAKRLVSGDVHVVKILTSEENKDFLGELKVVCTEGGDFDAPRTTWGDEINAGVSQVTYWDGMPLTGIARLRAMKMTADLIISFEDMNALSSKGEQSHRAFFNKHEIMAYCTNYYSVRPCPWVRFSHRETINDTDLAKNDALIQKCVASFNAAARRLATAYLLHCIITSQTNAKATDFVFKSPPPTGALKMFAARSLTYKPVTSVAVEASVAIEIAEPDTFEFGDDVGLAGDGDVLMDEAPVEHLGGDEAAPEPVDPDDFLRPQKRVADLADK